MIVVSEEDFLQLNKMFNSNENLFLEFALKILSKYLADDDLSIISGIDATDQLELNKRKEDSGKTRMFKTAKESQRKLENELKAKAAENPPKLSKKFKVRALIRTKKGRYYFQMIDIPEEGLKILEATRTPTQMTNCLRNYVFIDEENLVQRWQSIQLEKLKSLRVTVLKGGETLMERTAFMTISEYNDYLFLIENPDFDPLQFLIPFLNLEQDEMIKSIENPKFKGAPPFLNPALQNGFHWISFSTTLLNY